MNRSICNTENPAAHQPAAEASLIGSIVLSEAGHSAAFPVGHADQTAVLR